MIKQQQQVFLEENMSNLTSAASGEATSVSSGNNNIINTTNTTNNNKRGEPSNSIYPPHHQQQQQQQQQQQHYFPPQSSTDDEPQLPAAKKKRNLPGNPDPEAEVIALTPKSLLATNRFVCEICNKGFQRDQNLQLHRRGHNLPWKLKQRTNKEVRKKVYVCPEPSCVHHDPSRALGDLTGIKKHFCRKHGEKKFKCEKCSKRYAVQSDWKAHSKVCGTREYRCDCGTLFSRRDSFITHRAFCDALAEETARSITTTNPLLSNPIAAAVGPSTSHFLNLQQQQQQLMNNSHQQQQQQDALLAFPLKREPQHQQSNLISLPPWLACPPMDHTSSSAATAMFHHQDQMMQQHHQQQQQQQEQHQNPSNPNMGPTFGGPYHTTQAASHHPHMSATALLQKAAQMGATMSNTAPQQPHLQHQQQHFQQQQQSHVSDTNPNTNTTTAPTTTTAGLFGLNLSSRDHHLQQQQQQQQQEIMPTNLSSFEMNKAAATTTAAATATNPSTTGPTPNPNPGPSPHPPSSSSYFHDMMVNSLSSTYDHQDDAFGIGSMVKKDPSSLATFHNGNNGNNNTNGGGNDGLTRDFLGLRPLSHNEILTIAGLGNCMTTNNTTSHHHQQQQQQQQDSHKSWQGN